MRIEVKPNNNNYLELIILTIILILFAVTCNGQTPKKIRQGQITPFSGIIMGFDHWYLMKQKQDSSEATFNELTLEISKMSENYSNTVSSKDRQIKLLQNQIQILDSNGRQLREDVDRLDHMNRDCLKKIKPWHKHWQIIPVGLGALLLGVLLGNG